MRILVGIRSHLKLTGMWRVGEYVRVLLSENPRETRKAIIAIVNTNEMSDDVTFDIILFDTYGTFVTEETMGNELNNVPSSRLTSLLPWESTPRLSGSFSIDQLRAAGADMFRLCDWRGAIAVFTELLEHLDMGEFYLYRVDEISVRLARRGSSDICFEDCGEIDPINGLLGGSGSSVTPVGNFHIARDVRMHAATMLNLGRSYLSAGNYQVAEGKLSFAIYLASLADDQPLQSKGFYWRSKLRASNRRWKAAVRDAKLSCQLAKTAGSDDALIRECMIHERLVLRLLDEDNRSIRKAVGEIMQLCSEHMDTSDPSFNSLPE